MDIKKNAWKYLSGCVLAGVFSSGAARADDSGFYMGFSVGEATQEAGDFEGKDTSYRIFGGYSFNKYFAAEGGYVDGGAQNDELGSAIRATVASEGLFVAAVGKLPIGNYFAPFARLGYVMYDAKTTISSGGARITDSENGEELLFGVGCEFKLGEGVRLRAEWEKIDVPDADFTILSVAMTYQF
jgi:OmpA-OmpF porin, OOP family